MTRPFLIALALLLGLLGPAPAAYSLPQNDTPPPAEGEAQEPGGAETEPDPGKEIAEKGKAALEHFIADPWGETKYWLLDRGPAYALTLGQALLALLVFKILAGWAGRLARGALSRSHTAPSELLLTFVQSTVSKVVFFVGVVIALSVLGVNIGPFLAGIGVLGFVVGFALQDSLSNFAAGIMLMLYRPFDVGHFVEVAGQTGTVVSTTLVSTSLKTPDNQRLTIPNGKIWGDVIRNVTEQKERRVDLVFGIGYDDDIELAERTLAEIVAAHDKVLGDPAPVIKLHELADSSVNFVVRVWAKTGDYWDVYWDLTRQVKLTFDEKSIGIPYPHQEVYVHQAQ